VDGKQNLERILEAAIVMSWNDLVHDAQIGLMHVEYGFIPAGTLDYLKVWSSLTRGHWLLACEYWMSESVFHGTGVHFDNGYQSEGLAHTLDSVMQHQNSFELPSNLGRQGLLQISTPAEAETAAATALVTNAIGHLGSRLAEPAVA
jgi:hypothetical protein